MSLGMPSTELIKKQIIESYKTGLFDADKVDDLKVKVEEVPTPVVESGGSSSSSSGGPGAAVPAVAMVAASLPSLLTNYRHRIQNKQLLKSGGDLACAPMGIAGLLGDGKPIVSPWSCSSRF